jgi:shikimate kinase
MATFNRIFIVGPMGAGKTTVGRRLARIRGMEFADSDQELERRTGVDIPLIFEIEGEEGFRKRESQVIDELTRQPNTVLATGGGAVLSPTNREWLASRGFVIFLNITIDRQLERTRYNKNRPLLQTGERRKRLETLKRQREPLYHEIADLVMESGGRARGMARQIAEKLDEMALS